MRNILRFLPILMLTACPAHEGPIDVVLVDMDDTAIIEWAEASSDTFAPCENATSNPDAVAGCGPYGAGDPGDYTVRVEWQGVTVDKDVTLEKDGSYEANVTLTFSADEFDVAEE